ncbi:MAG: YiiX family permuted papain-like enzyme [Zoogloeaceae bacterium]|jgi:hypothetical protein|nr:YiiX family permuted papain-like enzyme [Zoogloeaceae bacterium]
MSTEAGICHALIILACLAVSGYSRAQPAVNEGDLIFHTSRSAQSKAVQQATGSRYSHMGIILFRQGKPHVFEASATVRHTPLSKWIARGTNGRYVVKRLKTAQQALTPDALKKLRKEAEKFADKPYDLTFEWSDERIYCSELVWKIYDRALDIQIGKLQKIREFNLDAPAVKQKIRERYGNKIPLDETVISPQAMFESPLLRVVTEK